MIVKDKPAMKGHGRPRFARARRRKEEGCILRRSGDCKWIIDNRGARGFMEPYLHLNLKNDGISIRCR
jgi:hypothetical protein